MIYLFKEHNRLIVEADNRELAPRHENQLRFWGFEFDSKPNRLKGPNDSDDTLLFKVLAFLSKSGCQYTTSKELQSLLDNREDAEATLAEARTSGQKIKEGSINKAMTKDFLTFLSDNIPRKLKEHQLKAALHLLSVKNGANFSVPGSGKTTVVLVVYDMLRQLGEVDSLFVVGPPSCFGPWRTEYKEVLGKDPSFEILAGGDIDNRRTKYLVNKKSVCDFFLTTFQTLYHDWEQVRCLFKHQGLNFFLVIDEAHYIKQIEGAWANAVLKIAPQAKVRSILTGTPFPCSYSDAFNLFDTLWPNHSPISENNRQRIEHFTKENRVSEAAEILDNSIGSLFYRVRKSDLGLAPQVFHTPIKVKMKELEKRVYDSITDRIREISRSDFKKDFELLVRLRRGRMMRLRQCLSYTLLLRTAITDYDEDLFEKDQSIADIVWNYEKLETPGKIDSLNLIVQDLLNRKEKVVIWSNFILTLKLIREKMQELDTQVGLIYGATPIYKTNMSDELTREAIIKEFLAPKSGIDVLVANPAACAESISLHKTCSNAIYFDLSYNCAQYLQSLDRIHRVGGSEDKSSHYFFLQYEDSMDEDILSNVQRKAQNMSRIIDQDYAICSLDMFAEDEEIEAYDRLFSK